MRQQIESMTKAASSANAAKLAGGYTKTNSGIWVKDTAAINANTTAQTQKILDAMAQNKIESLQAQVNQLQLQSAMCGVVRYPNATTYTSGVSPFWNQSCCNTCCNI